MDLSLVCRTGLRRVVAMVQWNSSLMGYQDNSTRPLFMEGMERFEAVEKAVKGRSRWNSPSTCICMLDFFFFSTFRTARN